MKSCKRVSCFLLVLLMLGQTLAGCQEKETTETTPVVQETTQESETETEDPNRDDLPDGLDYDGYNFRVFTYKGGNNQDESWKNYVDVDLTGEVLNDAAYNRNLEVEERLNIQISCIEHDAPHISSPLEKNVMAGTDAYDLCVQHPSPGTMLSIIKSGCLYDVNNMPNLDLDKPYYDQNARDAFSIHNKLFMLAGDYICMLRSTTSIWYNTELWKDYALEDPYALVKEGKWTFDKCISLSEGTYVDLNGDGKKDDEDQFGITGLPTTIGYAYTAGGGTYFHTTKDGFAFTVTDEHNISLIEKIVGILDNEDVYTKYSDSLAYRKTFFAGNSLMFFSGSSIVLIRDLPFTTGILPFPKYDESQSEYMSAMASGFVIIPVTIADPERNGAITETLFSSSARLVKDAFYQQYVDNKVLQDEGSVEMLKIIMENGIYDFTQYIDPSSNIGGLKLVSGMFSAKSTDIVSKWASVQNSVETKYTEFFEEMK